MDASIFVLVAVVVAFYVVLLRPVLQQQRRRRRDVSSLAPGDEVLTTGGFYATVVEIRTTDAGPMELVLEIAPGVRLRGTPAAVEQITKQAPRSVRQPAGEA
ncbi:MAG: preprotein translocase subunit YajC [Dehalococcoidia bacterium]|nr:preprotein translocase subunit YajC [Dehalococcoidia bacterium]